MAYHEQILGKGQKPKMSNVTSCARPCRYDFIIKTIKGNKLFVKCQKHSCCYSIIFFLNEDICTHNISIEVVGIGHKGLKG